MAKRLGLCLILSAILVLAASCSRYGEPGPGEQKSAIVKLAEPDAIPASWGKLVAVSSVTSAEDWVQLWFQDEGGTIRMTRYNVHDRFLSTQAIEIHRN
jgi:hypothetical protein